MGIAKYYKKVSTRALQRTLNFLGYKSRERVLANLLLVLLVATVLMIWGSRDSAGDMFLERMTLWVLVALAFPFIYLWHFIRSPALIDEEQLEHIEQMNGLLAIAKSAMVEKQDFRQKAHTLSVLVEQGDGLFIQRITEGQFEEWKNKLHNWEQLTLFYISNAISHQDAVQFRSIKFDNKENYLYKINDEHNNLLRQTNIRLEKIRKIIDRYREEWAPLTKNEHNDIIKALQLLEMQALNAKSGETGREK